MRGIPRQAVNENTPIFGSNHRAAEIADREHICTWNPDMYGVAMSKPGAQGYYDSIASLYASWGVDFIKADDMSRPYEQRRPEVIALSEAIRKTGRPMLLSLAGPSSCFCRPRFGAICPNVAYFRRFLGRLEAAQTAVQLHA